MSTPPKRRAAIRRGFALAVILSGTLGASPASAYVISSESGVETEGWDGAGLGSVTINWFLGNPLRADGGLPSGVAIADVRAAIIAAMNTWSAIAAITFVEIAQFIQPNSIDIYWAPDDHGDGNAFDGAWNPGTGDGFVLAHGYPPEDIAANNIVAGNIHLDRDETWVTSGAAIGANSATIDIESIILHELGHALGLGHSNEPGAVMNPLYFGEARTLGQDDIDGILALYAAADSNGNGSAVPEPGSLALLGLALVMGAAKNRLKL